MKVLVDENVAGRVIQGLRAEGHDVELVKAITVGMSDRNILAEAFSSGALLLTEDSDFGEIVFRDHHATVGVLYLRLDGVSIERRVMVVLDVLNRYRQGLFGCFTVIDHAGTRIRQRRLDEDRA